MRTLSRLGVIALLVGVAGVALAASSISVESYRKGFSQGVVIGKAAFPKNDGSGAGNVVTASFGTGAQTVDLPNVLAATCGDSAAISVPGVKAGDSCSPGVPATVAALNLSVTCYVSAADNVKFHACNPTAAAIDAVSTAGFYARVTSSQ